MARTKQTIRVPKKKPGARVREELIYLYDIESLHKLIKEKFVDDPDGFERVQHILYGRPFLKRVVFPEGVVDFLDENNFKLKEYIVEAEKESIRDPRKVRIGIIQHKTQLDLSAPVLNQIKAIHNRVKLMIEAASMIRTNIICLPEAWTMPLGVHKRESLPWTEFAESAENGMTSTFLKNLAKQYNMVIVSPILERDENHLNTIWNTAVVIDNHGKFMGKSRQNHNPKVGRDSSSFIQYTESELDHSVFETEFGKIAININQGRHYPLNWLMYKFNGAEIVFNPCGAIDSSSETCWPIEARNAAIANSYFTCAINRVGNEFNQSRTNLADFSSYYGSSYITAPDGRRTPGLSTIKEGLLVAEVDLNLCRQASDKIGFSNNARLPMYIQKLNEAVKQDFEPQVKRARIDT